MLTPGTLLQNRYEIVRLIGRGGMGAVYEARDQRLGNRVALKQTLVVEESLRRAFEREARILAELHHPILPGVSDHFIEGEGQYLVMRYIPGEDLAGLMKAQGSGFPLPQVLTWAEQLLDGLDYLHGQEPPVIHRDIKPQNLKVTARGAIILLDFGLAKGGQIEGGQVTGSGNSVFGYTPHYAPLEQIQGSGTDPRSDLYALGATLYHLMTGQEPPDALARATALLGGQPDPLRPAHEVNPQISPALGALLARAMAPSAPQRYDSARAMQAALRASGEEPPTATLPNVAVPAETMSMTHPVLAATPSPVSEPLPAAEPVRSRPFLLPLALVAIALLIGTLFFASNQRDETAGASDGTPTAADSVFSPGLPNPNADQPALLPTETIELVSLPLSATRTPTERPSPSPSSEPFPEPSATPVPALPSATRPPAPTRTVVPTRTVPSSATPSVVPPTATASASPAPPTSTPTPTPGPVGCAVSASPLFAFLWESHQSLLGCPTSPATTIPVLAEEAFEGGHAFWRSDTDQMFVVFDRSISSGSVLTEGFWQSDANWRWDGSNPEGIGLTPPEGRVEPIRGFGFVWRTFLNAQDGPLGWALEPERGLNNVGQVQRFEQGLMFRGGGATIYLLLDDQRFLRR